MPELTHLALVAGLAIVAGAFRGFAGFGSGLLMAPIITLFIAPSVAVPVLLILAFFASVRLVPEVWGAWNVRRVLMLAVPAVAAIPLGEFLLMTLEPRLMQRIISGVVLVLVAALATGWRSRRTFGWKVVVPAGLTSGLLTGMGGVGGPPVVLVNMADSEAADARANLIGFFIISQIAALATFALVGVIEPATYWYAGTAVVPFVIAIHFGALLFRPERAGAWRLASLVLLAAIACVGLVAEPVHDSGALVGQSPAPVQQ